MRVVSKYKDSVVTLGFAPVSCVLLAGFLQRGVVTFGPSGAGAPVKLAKRRTGHFNFTSDGQTAIFVEWDSNRVCSVDLTTPAKSYIDLPRSGDIGNCWLFDNGTRMVTTHSSTFPGAQAAWQLVRKQWKRTWRASVPDSSSDSLAVCPTGTRLAYLADLVETSTGYALKTRDLATGKREATGAYPFDAYSENLCFHPDGRQIVATVESKLAVWSVPKLGEPRIVKNLTAKHFTGAAYHPNGQLFTTSNDATVTVWDTNSWEPLQRFEWKVGRLRSVAVSPDGALAAVGSENGKIVVWDVDA